MVIFTYKLLCGTIFIPFAVHRPMNPPHSSAREFIHRTVIIGKGSLCLSYFNYAYLKICNEKLADFFKNRDACGLVPVRVHAFLSISGPFLAECTVRWMGDSSDGDSACGLVPVRMHGQKQIFIGRWKTSLAAASHSSDGSWPQNAFIGLVPVRMHSFLCNSGPFLAECTVRWMGDSSDGAPPKEWK